MTRFPAIALALLLVVPAKAETANQVQTIYPYYDAQGRCISLRCFGEELLRQAYQRGEISSVHLSTRSECDALGLRPHTIVQVPCTWDHDDFFKP